MATSGMTFTNGNLTVTNVKESVNTQSASYQGNNMKVTRTFYCDWGDRRTLCTLLMGWTDLKAGSIPTNPITSTSSGSPLLVRYAPLPYAGFDVSGKSKSDTLLYPTGIERLEGCGPLSNKTTIVLSSTSSSSSVLSPEGQFKQARITVIYDDLTYKPISGSIPEYTLTKYVTKIVDPICEALRMPVGYYKWAYNCFSPTSTSPVGKAGAPATGSYIKFNTLANITYIWHQVPAVLTSETNVQDTYAVVAGAIYGLGRVNSDTFDGYPPGTLLLTSVRVKPYRWINGTRYYDYEYKMKYFQGFLNTNILKDRPSSVIIGHNHFYRYVSRTDGTTTLEPTYCLITNDGTPTGRPVFTRYNYEYLFIPATYSGTSPLANTYLQDFGQPVGTL